MYNFSCCKLHNIFQSSIVCIYDLCTQKNRIACIKCVQEFHSDHVQQCVLMEELMEASSELTNKMDCLVKLTADTGQDDDALIDDLFMELKTSVFLSIEMQRLSTRERYREKQELYGDMIKELTHEFREIYSIAPIRGPLVEYSNGTIDMGELNTLVTAHVKNPDRQQRRNNLLILYKNCVDKLPKIDHQEIEYLKAKVVEEMSKMSSLVRIPGNWFFVIPQVQSYNGNLKTLDGGSKCEFGTQDQQQYVYGSQPLKAPAFYQWTYMLDDAKGMGYNTVYMGIVLDSVKEDVNQMFAVGKCLYIDINNNSFTQHLQLKSGKKQLNQVIKDNNAKKKATHIQFLFDTKKKVITIQDSEELSKYEYSKSLIKKSNQTQSQTLLHLDFFKQSNSYRPFIMNYSGVFQVQLI